MKGSAFGMLFGVILVSYGGGGEGSGAKEGGEGASLSLSSLGIIK